MGYEKLLGMGYKIFLGIIYEKFLKMGYEKFLRMGIEKFLRIGSDIFPGNNHKKISSPGQTPATVQCSSQEFLNGESSWNFCWHFQRIFLWKIPGNFDKFPGIFAGFPRNCCLGWSRWQLVFLAPLIKKLSC